jgi:hypothetical protein
MLLFKVLHVFFLGLRLYTMGKMLRGYVLYEEDVETLCYVLYDL